jgi:hypothetical protein
MPGLQTRHSEDTSSDDDSDYDKKPTKASTTMQWKVPIDDSDGKKFTCRNTVEKEEVEFFPTDPHLFCTCTIIEENGFLFKEREMDGLIFYDSLEVLDDPDNSDQYWTTCSGAPSLTPIIGFVDTESYTDFLNDLSVFRPTEHEYWNDWLLDELTRRILTQATIGNCHHYNINASDLAEIMSPLKPRMTQPSEIDYELKRKYFAHLPASVVKATFKHTTQNMRLSLQLTYIRCSSLQILLRILNDVTKLVLLTRFFQIHLLSTVVRKVHIYLLERNRNSPMLTNQRTVHLLNS